MTYNCRYAWLPDSDVEYEGWVYKVEQKAVILIFCENFHELFPSGTLFNVRFAFNRMSYRHMHRAVDTADEDLVWPVSIKPRTNPLKRKTKDLMLFDTVRSLTFLSRTISSGEYYAIEIV
jgi:hypothetical protein